MCAATAPTSRARRSRPRRPAWPRPARRPYRWPSVRARDRPRALRRTRRRLIRRTQRLEKGDQRVHFGWGEVLAVGRHVAPALEHLSDQLITGEPRRDSIERGAARSAFAAEAVTVPATLGRDGGGAPQFEQGGCFERRT